MEITDRIFALLLEQKKTAKQLCEFVGISQASVSAWKTSGSYPSSKHVVRISEFLGVSPNYLLTGEDSPKPGTRILNEEYQKDVAQREFSNLTEDQVALINAYEKLTDSEKEEIWLIIDHKIQKRNLSSNSRTSKDGSSGSKTA